MTKKRPATNTSLTLKQEKFVREYLVDGNATRAATAAGYSARTAASQAHDLLKKAHIQAALQVKVERTLSSLDVTVERVLKERARLAFFDPRKFFRPDGTLIPIPELDDDTAAALAGMDVVEMAGGAEIGGEDGIKHVPMFTKKVKLADKDKSLTALEHHLGMRREQEKGDGVLNIHINLA